MAFTGILIKSPLAPFHYPQAKAITPTKWISSDSDFIQALIGFNPSKTDFIAIASRKTKNTPATTNKIVITWGAIARYHPSSATEAALHFTLRSTSDSNKRYIPENQKRKTP